MSHVTHLRPISVRYSARHPIPFIPPSFHFGSWPTHSLIPPVCNQPSEDIDLTKPSLRVHAVGLIVGRAFLWLSLAKRLRDAAYWDRRPLSSPTPRRDSRSVRIVGERDLLASYKRVAARHWRVCPRRLGPFWVVPRHASTLSLLEAGTEFSERDLR